MEKNFFYIYFRSIWQNNKIPFKEDDDRVLGLLLQKDVYSSSKALVEHYLEAHLILN